MARGATVSERDDDKPAAASPSPGAQLRSARESRSMSVSDVAGELRLDAWMVEALEADEYGRFGASVFAKGHLRKYAVLLGIEPDDLMMAYYDVQSPPDAPPLISVSNEPAEDVEDPIAYARFGL